MSGGKASARDIRYGRQGGRWAPPPAPARPVKPPPDKAELECKVCGRKHKAHTRPCRFCGRDEMHHADGDLEVEVQARARMATARREAGLPLSELDLSALSMWGDQDLGKVGAA